MFLLVLVGAIAVAGTAAAATSPKAFRAAVLEAELAQRSVHYVIATSQVGASSPGVRARAVADVARDRGIQRWTYSKSGKTGHLTILLVHSTPYVHGDRLGLQWAGFGAQVADRYAGKWLSIPRNSPISALLVRNVTLGSFAKNSLPAGSDLSLGSGTAGAKPVRALHGTAPEGGSLTIYVPESGTPLPVEGIEVESGAQVGLGHVTLSGWNEPVRVRAPTHSVPLQTP